MEKEPALALMDPVFVERPERELIPEVRESWPYHSALPWTMSFSISMYPLNTRVIAVTS